MFTEMQNNPASIWQHHPKTTSSPWHCSGINIYPLFFSCRVNFSLWGLLSIQTDTHLSDRQKHMNTQLLPHRQTNSPKSSAFFFSPPTFSHMEILEVDLLFSLALSLAHRESNTCHLFIRAGMRTTLEISICL